MSKNPTLIAAVFFSIFSVSMGMFFLLPSEASALTLPEAKQICEKKADKAACLRNVASCAPQNTSSCLTNKVILGPEVVPKGCITSPDPQACQTACKPKPASERPACLASQGVAGTSAEANEIDLDSNGKKTDRCGAVDKGGVETQFNFGCTGEGSPIVDFAYAFIRFLSFGVGLVLIASIIYAGIQYTSSTGNPEATAAAKDRILNAIVGLLFYMLIFALIQYLVPGGLFNG